MLRQATFSDLDLILSMASKFSQQIATKELVDEDVMLKVITTFLSDESRVVFLYGDVGMLAACISTFPFGTATMANEVAWWVEPEARKQNVGQQLVEAYEAWAKEKGCKLITMACYANNSLGSFYEKCGYTIHELGYIKCLPH